MSVSTNPVSTVPVSTAGGTASGAPDASELLTESLTISELLIGDRVQSGLVADVISTLDSNEGSKIVYRQFDDAFEVSDQTDYTYIVVLIDDIFYSESFTRSWEALQELQETVTIGELLSIFLSDQLAEQIDVSDLWSSYGLILTLRELIRISELVQTPTEVNEVLAEALALLDVTDYVLAIGLTDNVDLSELFELSLQAINQQLEQIVLADALDYSVTITALVDESIAAVDQPTTVAEILRLLEDGLLTSVRVTSDTGVYEAWTMNTMTGAATLYDNFPFNSFALHTNGKYLGAAEGGIYELDGSDDDGVDIDASFKTGLRDFGFTLSKRMVDAWFTMTASGELLLKVTTVEDNGKVERWYEVKKTPRMHRAKMARGVKSMFWQFELSTINGEQFDVDNMALHPLPLNRRY